MPRLTLTCVAALSLLGLLLAGCQSSQPEPRRTKGKYEGSDYSYSPVGTRGYAVPSNPKQP